MLMNLPEILKSQKKWKARKFKPVKVSKRTELWYRQQLKQFVKTMTSDIEGALQQPQRPFFMDSADGFKAISAKALLDYLKKYAETDRTSQAENIAQGFVNRGDVQNQAEVATNLKNQTGVDLAGYLHNSPNIAEKVNAMTAANVQLIKSIRSQYLDKVQNTVTQALVSGSLNKDLAAQIKALGQTTEKRAAFIARDQSSKLNAALTQARHEELGIQKYMWSTSGDERVRESHAELDGQVFSYDKPPAVGNPGQDFNCRCVAIPMFDLPENKASQGLEQNQGIEQEQESEKTLSKDFTEAINIGKNLSDKYKAIIDKAIAGGKPHEGIMEIMRKEGVELGGQVNVRSLDKRAVLEVTQAVQRYPKNWVDVSNSASSLVVKESKSRAFQYQVPNSWNIEQLKTARVKWGALLPIKTSIQKGLVKNGDTFIVSNTNHNEAKRISTLVHEYGHKLQRELPELDRYFVDFWHKATAGDKVEKLADLFPNLKFRSSEITKKDHFPHPYFGKMYGNASDPKPMEMLTMTFQALLGGNMDDFIALKEKSPDLFNMGLALLTRFKK